MTEFQKIAIGILGLTHPEMFLPRPSADQGLSGKIAAANDATKAAEPVGPGPGRASRMLRAMRFMLAALAIGSRTVAMADNSELRRDLSARASLLYGLGKNR
jgi:hypothetical protein